MSSRLGKKSQSDIVGISVGVQPRQKCRSVYLMLLSIGPYCGVLSETPHTFAQCLSYCTSTLMRQKYYSPPKGVFCFLTVNVVKQISQLAGK